MSSGTSNDAIAAALKRAVELLDAGDDVAALAAYHKVLELDFNLSAAHYDIGLIHKYRREWKESFRFNKRATELAPEDEAAQWNLAIAATALRDWKTARSVWKGRGMRVAGEGPIVDNFGFNPIRLKPDDEAEVVWARRLCPVRARVDNIPFPESEVAFQDVVLHDGAPVGYRLDAHGAEKAVFNMLELFEPGPFSTYVVEAEVSDARQIADLEQLCKLRNVELEDWTGSTELLCKACSEGRPHQQHDHTPAAKEWQRERRIGVAARDGRDVEALLKAWDGKVLDWGVALER